MTPQTRETVLDALNTRQQQLKDMLASSRRCFKPKPLRAHLSAELENITKAIAELTEPPRQIDAEGRQMILAKLPR